jgi:tetratricopeptide (TPR) repeat protein
MLNRETAILLIPVYIFYRWDEMDIKELTAKLIVLSVIGLGIYVGLRKYFGVKEYYSEAYYLNFNLIDTRNWLYIALLFNVFLVLSWKDWAAKPKFLQRAALMIPFFVIIHFTMTVMREARLWLPMYPLVLSLGLFSFLPEEVIIKKDTKDVLKKEIPGVLSKLPSKVLYICALGGFFVFFIFFYNTYNKYHLKELGMRKEADKFSSMADDYLKMNMSKEAQSALNTALSVNPNDPEINYKLAKVYNYYLFDRDKALYYYTNVLKLSPYHYDKKTIEWEIKRLEAMK